MPLESIYWVFSRLLYTMRNVYSSSSTPWYEQKRSGKARFRVVLTSGHLLL